MIGWMHRSPTPATPAAVGVGAGRRHTSREEVLALQAQAARDKVKAASGGEKKDQ